MKFYILLFCWILLIYDLSVVEGKCCGNHRGHMGCAGCGPCNIFCCNCDNGCNNKWHAFENRHELTSYYKKGHAGKSTCGHWDKKREIALNSKNASLEADKLFRDVDTDDSRSISINETKKFLANKTKFKRSLLLSFKHSSFEEEFAKMDENNDRMISPFEFDESLEN